MQTSSLSISLKSGRTLRFWLRLATMLLLAILLIPPMRLGIAGYQTYSTLSKLVILLRSVDHPHSLSSVQPTVKQLQTDLTHLQDALYPIMPILRPLSFMPRYGQLLATLDNVVDVGKDAVLLLDKSIVLIQDAPLPQGGNGSAAWVEVGPILAPLSEELSALEAKAAALPLSQLNGQLGKQLAAVHSALKLATFAVELGPAWPELLGKDHPSTYLLLVQNNHELRATGGFISSLALITFVNGELQPVDFVDSYTIFSQDLAYPPAPATMQTYMGIQLLTLRDANWSPHLPSDAVLIRSLYQQHTGLMIDGIIAVDLDAVALLLPAFNRLTLPGSTIPITQQNVEEMLVQLWNNPLDSVDATSSSGQGDWWTRRKDFVGQLTSAAFGRIQQRAFNPLFLIGGVAQGLERRSVQAWFFDPTLQPSLAARGWDGGLHPQRNADYIAVVDTNLGYNKADAIITRQLDYELTWSEDPLLGAEATLVLTYTHPIDRTDPVCKAVSYYGTRYEEMMARCYFNYSRVYVPAGSELLSVEGWLDTTVSSERAEQGTQRFAGYFVLNPGRRHQVTIRYRLPATLRPDHYQLVIQRQAGTAPLAVKLQTDSTNPFEQILIDGQLLWIPTQ